ncbi:MULTISPECIES: mannose-6-phosphate isomerase, class I [Thermoactinomyces]|uniref:Mannose-6-phosphate isomerase n=1 Tax=Thermoactinomyces daqus TaxID=1329516 RepID=A0A7W1XAH0_9BACL|nr:MULTISPECIES: mannose-6-phosphate isomerase, class I [Thermoactinomyces]MBA4542979.1 mannose-6-phosphate isomerase, class I [Thermoactinomyces daqus]MBH8598642.1 mannose-6-phosphate isomerase, class I [Thermoactinomyces sp. CICC 10523]MBH8605101.1 mannose-6-phosphate isomerase, class I [Thermoactinomyces sp. CICC 10522]MBH8606358.1 mannose-6-phosphate isomerase, class I [Thermoactinomyces sp. CICC 10521]
MHRYPIFLKPVFKERIWGGTRLKEEFGYDIPSGQTGECWAISAHPHGQSIVKNGPYAGMTLGELWSEKPEFFGISDKADTFPLLTKILHASSDLSVQVHPDDAYANLHENGERGKTECWYVIDCDEGAEIIYGHTAHSKEELISRIKQGDWKTLLKRVKVKPGDFFYVPSGTVHALGAGTLILETQQNSDTTYRLYDYDRTDANGNKRELHLKQAIEVINVPHEEAKVEPHVNVQKGGTITTLVQSPYFTVQKWELDGVFPHPVTSTFLLTSVISGSGELSRENEIVPLTKGDHFILPAGYGPFNISGKLTLIVSRV